MGRKNRIWIPEHFFHIVCRGNRREPLFYDTDDFFAFLYILEKVYEKAPFTLAAYCLMTNHFHLQMKSEKQPISKVMAMINKRYANYFNTRYNLIGHVFEKRFYSDLIYDATAMLEVSRYIHMNPVKANMVDHPCQYEWSSYSYYVSPYNNAPDYMDVHSLLQLSAQYAEWCLSPPE